MRPNLGRISTLYVIIRIIIQQTNSFRLNCEIYNLFILSSKFIHPANLRLVYSNISLLKGGIIYITRILSVLF